MKLLCLFVIVTLCATLCTAHMLKAQPESGVKMRIKRQAIITPGSNLCPDKGYVPVNGNCIECHKYLQESAGQTLIPVQCRTMTGGSSTTHPFHYCLYFVILVFLTVLNNRYL